MAGSYQSAMGAVRAALVSAIRALNSSWVTSAATTFPRVEIGELTEQRTQDKGDSVRRLYCNIDVISQTYGGAVSIKSQIDSSVVGVGALAITGFGSIDVAADNVTEIIEPQEGSFTIYRLITRLEIIAETN